MRWRIGLPIAGLIVAAAVVVAWSRGLDTGVMADSAPAVPTTHVSRGELELSVYMTGDLRASRQAALNRRRADVAHHRSDGDGWGGGVDGTRAFGGK